MFKLLDLTKSKLRLKLLAYFFTNQEAKLYLREIAGLLGEDPGNLSKELSLLTKEGIFVFQKSGQQKYFYLNKKYPLYQELKSIISKTIGVEGSLKEILRGDKSIKFAFIYGSFASGQERNFSDIDLFIIGEPAIKNLSVNILELENKLKREINYTFYPIDELKSKLQEKDSFLINIFNKQDKIMLVGEEDELRRLIDAG
jgi:predicted nucleotidyltransferase